MAVRQKMSETGWFYHAPEKRVQVQTPEDLPPASQIPGLSELPEYQEEPPKRGFLKESDTKYVRLCKMGGRQDLLRFRGFQPKTTEAKPYPKVDWFYLEDAAAEEAEKPKEKWDFKLPEYMVHEEYKPLGADYDYERPKRLPYAYDRTTVFEREGATAPTDKKIHLPEAKRPGFGVRFAKGAPKGPKAQPVVKMHAPHGELEDNEGFKYKPLPPLPSENERPNMGKILSFSYDREWKQENQKWHNKQDKIKEKFDNMTRRKVVPVVTEYKQNFNTLEKKNTQKILGKGKVGSKTEHAKGEPTEKPLFKLSKYNKVPARTDSHRFVHAN